MFCYTFVSSNLLFCASLFLFYFVYACSFVFVEGVMWPQSRNCSGTAYKLSFFSADLDMLNLLPAFERIYEKPLSSTFEMKLRALCLHREVMFSSLLVSACRGCAFLLQTITFQQCPQHTIPPTLC